MEIRLHLPQDMPLNSPVRLSVSGINLAELEVHFQLES
jgi:hypothetical protein